MRPNSDRTRSIPRRRDRRRFSPKQDLQRKAVIGGSIGLPPDCFRSQLSNECATGPYTSMIRPLRSSRDPGEVPHAHGWPRKGGRATPRRSELDAEGVPQSLEAILRRVRPSNTDTDRSRHAITPRPPKTVRDIGSHGGAREEHLPRSQASGALGEIRQ